MSFIFLYGLALDFLLETCIVFLIRSQVQQLLQKNLEFVGIKKISHTMEAELSQDFLGTVG